MHCPVENKWLRDNYQQEATQKEGKHEMHLDCNPVTAERSIYICVSFLVYEHVIVELTLWAALIPSADVLEVVEDK